MSATVTSRSVAWLLIHLYTELTLTFWRKDKRSKNVAMIEQFWLRDTHLPPGGTTRGRASDVEASPIVSQRQPTLVSIGVADARRVKKQRMILTNAKPGTVFLRDIGESHWWMFRARFPDDGGSTIWLRSCVTHTRIFHLNTEGGWNCERTLAPASQWAQCRYLFTIKLQNKTKNPPNWRLLVHHVRAKRLDSQPGKNEDFPRTFCPVRRRGRFKILLKISF